MTGHERGSLPGPDRTGAGTSPAGAIRTVVGSVELVRVGFRSFPVFELRSGETALARLGRWGWLRIYFGNGQTVVLPDGERWTVRATGVAGAIWAVVVDDAGRKVAMAGAVDGSYGINTRDRGYAFYPTDPTTTGRGDWTLRRFETDVAAVARRPLRLQARDPVPLGVALLSLVIVRFGIPRSGLHVPPFRWR